MTEGSPQNVAAYASVAVGIMQPVFYPLCLVAIAFGIWGLIEAAEIEKGWFMSFAGIGLGLIGINVIMELSQ